MLSCTACRARLACDLLGEILPSSLSVLLSLPCLHSGWVWGGMDDKRCLFVCLFVVERGKEQERQRKEKEEA